MILTFLLGCGEEPPAEEGTPAVEEAAPYLGEIENTDSPSFDSDQVAAAVEEAIGLIRQIDADPVLSVYSDLLSQADEGCPLWTDYDGTPLWYDACTTDSGVAMEGYGLSVEWSGQDGGDGVTWWGTQLYSVSTIVDADGHTFTASGAGGSLYGTTEAGVEVFYNYLEDGFSWDGPEAEGTWLDWGLSPTLVWYMLQDPATGGRAFTVSGAVTIAAGPVAAVVLEEIYLVDEILGSSCGIEPSGTISVLDADGKWYDLIFDGPTDASPEVPAEVCDGCATAWYRGSPLGEACVDFSGLTEEP